MAVNYGTGTATQFTDATQRQVLELGKKIHYYNPSVTPILTVGGRASTRVSPVPIYEWMEDEYMLKKDIKHPGYHWNSNFGYPTKAHRKSIELIGNSPIHRLSFQLLPK